MVNSVKCTILTMFVASLLIFTTKSKMKSQTIHVLKRQQDHETGIVILTCSTKAEVMLDKARNVCKNVQWTGFYTKTLEVYKTTNRMPKDNLVVFVDSDVIANVEKIKTELKTAWALYNSTKVVFSSEPFCWVGRNCNSGDFEKFYKFNPHWRGYNFLNAGGFIGTAGAISAALQLIITNIKDFTAPKGYDDQYSAAELFRRGMVDLDYDNIFFGSFIDAKPWNLQNTFRQPSFLYNRQMKPSCIVNSQFAKNGCGWNPPKWHVNKNCSAVSDAWRTRPLFIHFNGAGHKSRAKMQGVKNAIEACK
jgi:hypothetical protein